VQPGPLGGVCAAGMRWNGSRCVRLPTLKLACPAGQQLIGNKCAAVLPPRSA
jgi:hypothetical protein